MFAICNISNLQLLNIFFTSKNYSKLCVYEIKQEKKYIVYNLTCTLKFQRKLFNIEVAFQL